MFEKRYFCIFLVYICYRMRKYKLTLLLLFFTHIFILAQEPTEREFSNKELFDLSVEELLDLNVNVQVTSPIGAGIFNSTSTVSIINKQTISDYNFQTISEAIQTVAGFSINNSYIKKNIPTSRGLLQNHYANKVLILLNGVPTFHAITGEGNLDRFDIHDVERIEVLKGPGSVLYGSNAYAGAINIILKTKNESKLETHVSFGSRSLLSTGARSLVDKNEFKLFVSGNTRTHTIYQGDFIDENGEQGIVSDMQRNQNITLLASHKASSLLLNGYASEEGFLGVLPTYANGAGNSHRLNGYLLNYRYNKALNAKLNFKGDIATDLNHRDVSRDRGDSIRSSILGYRINSDLKFSYQLSDQLSFDAGALFDYRIGRLYTNYIRQTKEIISHNNLQNKTVLEHSYFAQANITLNQLTATIGGRYTKSGQFGENISPRATIIYNINKKSALKAIYGESYRAPSLFELHFVNPDTTIFGNEYLNPETMRSAEIAYLQSFNHLFFQITAYHALHKDKIERVNSDIVYNNRLYTSKRIYMNGEEYESYGIEVDAKYNNPKLFQSFLNYAFCTGNQSSSTNSQHYFKYVPEHQLSVGLHKSFKKHFFSSTNFNIYSATNGALSTIPTQHTLDLNIGYKRELKQLEMTHTLGVKNILNSTIYTPEYIRGNINSIPTYNGFTIFYSLKINIY